MVFYLLWLFFLVPFLLCIVFGFYMAYKLYHPYRKSKRLIDLEGCNARKLRIPSSRGAELDALYLSVENAKHVVIVAHEIGAFKESKLKIARKLLDQGFNVLLFDLRNHGESSKDRTIRPMSQRFTDDIASALQYARDNFSGMEKYSLYSFSFSTFPALYIVTRNIEQPDSIILDSGPSIRIKRLYGEFLDEIGKEYLPALFKLPVVYPFLKYCFQYFGFFMLATNWPPDLSKLKGKVLFLMNSEDTIFPESEICDVANKIKKKKVWVCQGSTHLQGYKKDPEKYEEVLFQFLNS